MEPVQLSPIVQSKQICSPDQKLFTGCTAGGIKTLWVIALDDRLHWGEDTGQDERQTNYYQPSWTSDQRLWSLDLLQWQNAR